MGYCVRARVSLVLDSEESDSLTRLAGSACTSDTVNVVLNGQRELDVESVSLRQA